MPERFLVLPLLVLCAADLNDVVTFSFPAAVTHYANASGSYEPYLYNGDAVLDLTAPQGGLP